jgi:hypothetical protein
MAQHDFNIANATFPSVRSDINSALTAINTTQSGTSRPSSAVAGTIWLDTTSATTPTLKYYDGADDISLATLDHSANTVNWLDSSVSITGLSTTATGTVLSLSDSANTSTVNLIIDNQKEVRFRETTANGTNYIGLKAPASVSADLTFTLPVAPTANNQALISSTAGVMSFTPYAFPASDGTSGQALVTNGSGTLSFGSSVPEQLVKSLPLASGNSVTAGKLASIGTNGEVVAYPTLNTFGTTRTNSTTTAYNAISTDGSRAIRVSQSQSNETITWTFSGVAISDSANPTNGTTTITESINTNGNSGYGHPGSGSMIAIYGASETKFQVYLNSYVNVPQIGCDASYQRWRNRVFTVVVDSSGNCTKGNVVSFDGGANGNGSTTVASLGKLTNTIFAFHYATSQGTTYKNIITLSSTSTTTSTSDADAEFWTEGTGKNSLLTTNNVLGIGTGATWRTASYTSSPIAIGTKTDTTQIGDYLSGGSWAKMVAEGTDSAEYVLATYTNTSGVARYITYSVNQTTGALTQVETGLQTVINSNSASSMVFKDKNSFVGSNASFAFTNGVANTPTFNSPYTLGTMRYNSNNLFYSFSTSLSGYPTNTGFTVNAYGTNTFNYLGVAKTTDSTTPVDIITDGVAGGFTGLTSGTLYYSTTPADGTITTSNSSGILVGKAISTTEILLQRSNTQ